MTALSGLEVGELALEQELAAALEERAAGSGAPRPREALALHGLLLT